jgi:hypothetical protein
LTDEDGSVKLSKGDRSDPFGNAGSGQTAADSMFAGVGDGPFADANGDTAAAVPSE